MNLETILLEAPSTETASGWSFNSLIMIGLLIVVFYFFMIRPQQKRQKEIKKFREALQVGNEVITSGGIYAKIKAIKDDHVIIEIANNVNVKIDKGSIFSSLADTQTAK